METTSYQIENFKIFSREFVKPTSKANFIIFHGFEGHSGRMQELGEFMSTDYNVFIPDFPYHGQSSGEFRKLLLQ